MANVSPLSPQVGARAASGATASYDAVAGAALQALKDCGGAAADPVALRARWEERVLPEAKAAALEPTSADSVARNALGHAFAALRLGGGAPEPGSPLEALLKADAKVRATDLHGAISALGDLPADAASLRAVVKDWHQDAIATAVSEQTDALLTARALLTAAARANSN